MYRQHWFIEENDLFLQEELSNGTYLVAHYEKMRGAVTDFLR